MAKSSSFGRYSSPCTLRLGRLWLDKLDDDSTKNDKRCSRAKHHDDDENRGLPGRSGSIPLRVKRDDHADYE
uniref:Uncharacterized protein n=1 Tax=Oryza sativa subsp. japonica TaxID=39947 RepID=Q10IY4_ORYSJ|nr:hypothetical protein LOC_Os03g32636 [Oryza sativa Japonica Group]